MELSVFRLQPLGAFHFGDQGIDLEDVMETCPSDTLYAALTWQSIQRGDPWVANASIVPPTPPFRVSSCFPYVGSVQLLPLPMLPPADHEVQKQGERKKFKNLRFVSLSLFTYLLEGGSLREVLEAGETRAVALQGGRVLIDAAEFASLGWNGEKRPIWRVESMPHVAIDRVNSSSAYYETGQVRFNQGCGLAVLATGDAGLLHALLVELGQAGLGGRRSKGLGQFTVEPPAIIELPSATSERLVMLSRYLPTGGELQAGVLGEHAAYGLEHVNGWLYAPGTTPQRRKPVWMLGAGSVVQSLAGVPPQGAIVDLKPVYASNPAGEPRHAIWRHGLALSVGAPLKEQP